MNSDSEPLSRIVLGPLEKGDAGAIHTLAGDRAIAATTLLIPHPYSLAAAEEFLDRILSRGRPPGGDEIFAIRDRTTNEFLGTIGAHVYAEHRRAEIGYWVGRPYWGRGIATEAVREIVRYSFDELGLHRLIAGHFACNPSSGRVLEKCGFTREGLFPHHVWKWDKPHDIVQWGILNEAR